MYIHYWNRALEGSAFAGETGKGTIAITSKPIIFNAKCDCANCTLKGSECQWLVPGTQEEE